ncbi:F0F1 ATP synthase subunit epsilon [Kushneria phosphatilytica]|uniref:ATP synthase epsilon chain n=1 Tax=Kushneria phosphatilytica TaxID=657387 RepID=A0A1S1NTU4_9GAMM|nr:F0F1 ATP synthase subunit epsilon [Kushneria phosphatilytica]OHV08881.1 F0F1 ATP synthase subunit epsilon [Kushneria phosphatilytica]QEL12602.1 F0F1 ATP synthase subunit epsilon [Kushneria phosphatilytica]
MASVQCNIVSTERSIFAGEVTQLSATGTEGELGIMPGHSPLLTELAPGPVYLTRESGEEEIYYVSGGFLEVQPDVISVLADTADRARDIDEAEAERARDEARRALDEQHSELDYSRALAELAEATARLRTLSQLRNRRGS